MNNLTIIGRLGAEPVVRMVNNSSIARISLGVNTRSENGETQTEWFEINLWNSLAVFVQQFYHTGDKIYVRGHLASSSYQAKDGTTHYVTQVVADEVEKMSTAKRNVKPEEQ